jgi:inactive STAND
MSSKQHLQNKHDRLQQQYDLQAEKLKELRRNYVIEAGTAVQFQLKKQIEQIEADLDELAQQLDRLEIASSAERLYRALLKLDYREQTKKFRRFIPDNSVAAFLIHGLPEYGQRWLLNRLMQHNPANSLASKEVKINLSRIARKSNVAALWRELSGIVGLGGNGSPLEISDRVYQLWQTQNVLLIFYDVDFLTEAYLHELIKNFWLPLATKVRNAAAKASQFQLLMFLIDEQGCVGSWNVPFAEQLEPDWEPHKPVKLPKLSEFCDDVLVEWLDYEVEDLPNTLTNQIEQTVKSILENSDNGIPELAIAEICRLSGCDWYEEREKWLRF